MLPLEYLSQFLGLVGTSLAVFRSRRNVFGAFWKSLGRNIFRNLGNMETEISCTRLVGRIYSYP